METGSPERLFVAVYPPAGVVEQLAELSRPDLPGVRWTRPEQWHLTLQFLGRADPATARRALDRLQATAVEVAMGPCSGPLGAGVLVIPAAGLDGLAAAVAAAMSGVGQAQADRPFLGHLTLARCRSGVPPQLIDLEFSAEFLVREVCLVRSRLGAEGARHEQVSARYLREERD